MIILFSLMSLMASTEWCYVNPIYFDHQPNFKKSISELYLGNGVVLLRSNETYCVARNSKKMI